MQFYSKGDENFDKYSSAIANVCGTNNPYSGNEYLRTSFDFPDYEYHRPCSKLPTKHKDIVKKCQEVYKNTGLIRNIIDLMSDFCAQGVRLSHESPTIEAFYNSWFNRVSGVDLTERFASSIFKNGSAILRRRNAKLTKADKRKIYQAMAEEIIRINHIKGTKTQIPYEYTFLNPSTVEIAGGAMAVFAKKKKYKIIVPQSLILSDWCDGTKYTDIIGDIPPEIKKSFETGQCIDLPEDNTIVYHYKKDEWEEWPTPIIFSILRDVQILDRMKLADLSALDGAINNIRIFTLGDLDNKIWPEEGAFAKLASTLASNTSAGIKEFVWGPDIKLIESTSEVYKFLGDDKYIPILNAIYAGMGIPPTLTGTDHSSGTTNNLISLKTLIRRLEYCRSLLIDFWTREIEIVRQVMGFRLPAVIEFDNNNLGEEEAEKKLWIELAERSIISDEAVIRKFGKDPRIENARMNREDKQRKGGKRAEKAGPYHNPQIKDNLKRELVSKGLISPADFDSDFVDIQVKEPEQMPQPSGRPKNSKDTSPRKRRSVSPVTKAGLRIWAEDAQAKVVELTTPIFLAHFNKKNMRSLSASEASFAEDARFGVLLNIEPLSDINEELVFSLVGSSIDKDVRSRYNFYLDEIKSILHRDLTITDIRNIQLDIYLEEKCDDNRDKVRHKRKDH